MNDASQPLLDIRFRTNGASARVGLNRLCRTLSVIAAFAILSCHAGTPEPAAHGFALGDVRLLDSPFKQASDRNARYLLSLEPDRLLHNTRKYAGLEPKGELYGGWESQGIAG